MQEITHILSGCLFLWLSSGLERKAHSQREHIHSVLEGRQQVTLCLQSGSREMNAGVVQLTVIQSAIQPMGWCQPHLESGFSP